MTESKSRTQGDLQSEVSTLKWRKYPNFPKWLGYLDGKHVATVLNPGSSPRVWVLGNGGFKELDDNLVNESLSAKDLKAIAEFAYHLALHQTLSREQREDMLHALGWSRTPSLSKVGWRNHYNSPEPVAHLDELVLSGHMQRLGDTYFVTKFGAEALGVPADRLAEIFPEVQS